jgi:hypothetical protein
MDISRIVYCALEQANAWPEFASLEWPVRVRVLTTIQALPASAVIEANGQSNQANAAIAELTGSKRSANWLAEQSCNGHEERLPNLETAMKEREHDGQQDDQAADEQLAIDRWCDDGGFSPPEDER